MQNPWQRSHMLFLITSHTDTAVIPLSAFFMSVSSSRKANNGRCYSRRPFPPHPHPGCTGSLTLTVCSSVTSLASQWRHKSADRTLASYPSFPWPMSVEDPWLQPGIKTFLAIRLSLNLFKVRCWAAAWIMCSHRYWLTIILLSAAALNKCKCMSGQI